MEERFPYLAGPKREKLVELRMSKAVLYLTEPELVRLLAKDPELWRRGLRRGKFVKRTRAMERRQIKCGTKR